MERRVFLKVLAAVGATASLAASPNALASTFSRRKHAKNEVYRLSQLAVKALKMSPVAALDQLNARFGAARIAAGLPKTLSSTAAAQDFAADRTVQINGWILSRTEGLLLAAAPLLRP
ncbi:MAG: hypothetical protein AAGC95_11660 [Pseudomonadota bacterium]